MVDCRDVIFEHHLRMIKLECPTVIKAQVRMLKDTDVRRWSGY
jgi:hypothetical protein